MYQGQKLITKFLEQYSVSYLEKLIKILIWCIISRMWIGLAPKVHHLIPFNINFPC